MKSFRNAVASGRFGLMTRILNRDPPLPRYGTDSIDPCEESPRLIGDESLNDNLKFIEH